MCLETSPVAAFEPGKACHDVTSLRRRHCASGLGVLLGLGLGLGFGFGLESGLGLELELGLKPEFEFEFDMSMTASSKFMVRNSDFLVSEKAVPLGLGFRVRVRVRGEVFH